MGTTTLVKEANNANNAQQNLDGFTLDRNTVYWGKKVVVSKDQAGNETKKLEPTMFKDEEEGKKAEAEGGEYNAVDVVVRLPKTLDALLSIADTPEKQAEAVNNHNRGVSTKIANRVRAKVLAQDDDTGEFTLSDSDLTNGALDMTDHILSESKRKTLSEEEKIDRFIAAQNWPEAKAKAIKEVMMQAAA